MSKNYDLIATVDIDIASPIVDDTSFDNLLILGPAPANGPKAPVVIPDVGVYSDISEVEALGFVTTGENADPVGVAARVAFAQTPRPTQVYIAIQKKAVGSAEAAQTIEDVNAAVQQHYGTNPEMSGCIVSYDQAARHLYLNFTGNPTKLKNEGLNEIFTALVAQGYRLTTDDQEFVDMPSFQQLPVNTRIATMTKNGEDVNFTVAVEKEGVLAVLYQVTMQYTEDGTIHLVEDDEPLNDPVNEVESPVNTVGRALATNGWYVLCTAGVDPAKYEEIAAYVETQEKIFVYTELGFFGAGENGANKSTVGDVYFRTMGVYAREETAQADEDIPDANRYENVAFAARWLNDPSGSETSAFNVLSAVYPSKLTSTEMKALAEANLNYFVRVGNKNITMNGKVMAGEWADVIRFRDWLKNDMQVRVVNLFVTRPKVPYTDGGIGLIQNAMLASLKAGQDAQGIAQDEFDEDGNTIPGYSTSVPLAASLTAAQKASRKLTGCKFKARLAGAIHFAELKGSLTYEL